jgi:hypothetical protein
MTDSDCRGWVARLSRGALFVRLATASTLLVAAAGAQQSPPDPLVGRWELNLARTHYGGGAEPRRRESFVCSAIDAGIDCTINSIRADGRHVIGRFSGRYDGTPGPTHGIPDVDQVRLARINEAIADATFTYQGRPVFAYRTVKAANGRSLTIISVDPATRAVLNSVVVYDRQAR